MSAFSYQVSISCSGEKETMAAWDWTAIRRACAAESFSCTASASVKSSQSHLACCAPSQTALFLPIQPGGSSVDSRRRTWGNLDASPRTISAVRSEDSSLTTRISAISGCCANDSTQAAMTASSSRAGTMAEIRGELGAEPVMKGWKRPDFPPEILYVIIAIYEYHPPEIVCLRQHGICLCRAGVFHLAPLPARRIVGCRKDGLQFPNRTEWQERAPVRPARQSGRAELLGDVVPAVRGRNACPDPVEPAHRQQEWHGAGRKRG